ncbi:hypothetical protein LMG28138_05576 [Pararobbsia alpina]|uniref:Uncharacterized protein n=1 Tax=Pararobbsia alpina TaxID=621374 RepID=A0A6S7BM43_9BURK|nr:hypothetical protein LMG28138_05576 [Pararobbsia alpina]
MLFLEALIGVIWVRGAAFPDEEDPDERSEQHSFRKHI